MDADGKVRVDAKALEEVLRAFMGPRPLILELQALVNWDNNPVAKLIHEYNSQV